MNNSVKAYNQQSKVINEFLEEWDFLGVISSNHKDEYSDLVNPILKLLQNNTNDAEFSEVMSKTITDQYGIDMKARDKDMMQFSKRVLKWWNAK